MRAALYACVSTKDTGQPNDNQLRELRAFTERLGYPVYQEYYNQESRNCLANRLSTCCVLGQLT